MLSGETRYGKMVDDSGILSLDFIAGFTIFLISFIIVATMISGLLVGLQAKTIDYDAVAYRTGVILVEDPGYAYNPAGGATGTNTTEWEFLDPSNKEDVKRFGLAISKDTPNILSSLKIDRFFNPYFGMSPEDYRSRLIFGDYPYRFSVSIASVDGVTPLGPGLPQSLSIPQGVTPPPEASSIRRIVRIKQPSNMTISLSDVPYPDFYVDLDSLELANRSQPYQIDVNKENFTIVLTNLNSTQSPPSVTLRIAPDGIILKPKNAQTNVSGTTVTTSFSPEDFTPFSAISKFYITYNFTPPEPPTVTVPHHYDYTDPGVNMPKLNPVAIVEVRAW